MPIHDLAALTWEEVRDIPRGRAVGVLPVGAIEAHGPHLPLGTDVIIAEAMARDGAAKLDARGYHVVLLPSLSYTPAGFAAAFPGTVSVAEATLTALVAEVAASLAAPLDLLALANAHLDPGHRRALDQAVNAAGARGARVVFPDLTTRPWGARLGDEFKSGACHAGRFEGSIVLAAQPELVREDVRRALPANPRSLSDAIREGRRTFHDAGGDRAYFGWPADATAAEGRALIDALGDIVAEAVVAA